MQDGRIALVTGGATRIGRAIVEDLAGHGFAVAIHCNRSVEEAEAAAFRIRNHGGRAVVVKADLTDMVAAQRVVRQACSDLGDIDLLVNNASLFEDDSMTDFGWEAWDRHFDVHLKAPVMLARDMAERLQGRKGMVVNIIDQRVWSLTPRFFSYTLSKSALWTATRTMAQALAPNIRVNAIGPGPTLPSHRQAQEDFDSQVRALIMGKGPSLGEFGATIRYLWEAGSVTGQMIALDGGQHLAWETPDVVKE